MSGRKLRRLRRPDGIIGRGEQVAKIEAALAQHPFDGQVLYFYGDGGMGKTRLLQEVGVRARQRERTLVVELIDLFLSRFLQPLALMNAIVDGIARQLAEHDPTLAEQAFASYRAEAGRAELDYTRSREPAQAEFLRGYRRIADAGYEVVLLVDTFETLNPGIVGTEQFNYRGSRRLESWLLDLIAQLPATLVALAGRKVDRQRQAVDAVIAAAPGRSLTLIEVGQFSDDDTRAFVDAFLQSDDDPHAPQSLPEEYYPELRAITDGRPVILALAVELYRYGLIDLANITDDLRQRYPGNLSLLSSRVITHILNDLDTDPVTRLLMKAVYLRKGITPALLAAIAERERSTETYADEYELFSTLVFVKSHPGEGLLTLHDEMYELLFGLERDPSLRQSPLWFEVAQEQADQTLRSADARRSTTTLSRQQRQTCQIDKMFYTLAHSPVAGYQLYRELSYNAIMARENDYEEQLQYELARFFEERKKWGDEYRNRLQLAGIAWEQVIFDENVRWLHRRYQDQLEDGRHYEQVITWANQLAAAAPAADEAATLALEVARLESARNVARLRPHVPQAYEALVRRLTRLSEQLAERRAGDPVAHASWRHTTLLLALAHNDYGYFERTRANLDTAVREYRESSKQFLKLGDDTNRLLRATALNNLGFARAQQGDLEGLREVDLALDIFQRQGALLSEARARNTRARVLNLRDDNQEALAEVLQARQVFESERERAHRELVLNCLAEGDVRRRLGLRVGPSAEQAGEHFTQAVARYTEAIELLASTTEVDRQIEARHGLGKAYRDRGYWCIQHGTPNPDDWRHALEWLTAAIASAGEARTSYGATIASIHQDIAVVHYNEGNLAAMEEALEQARRAIPERYDIVPTRGLTASGSTEQLKIYWQRLGMVEFYRGRLHMKRHSDAEGCLQFVRAFACLNHFAPEYHGRHELSELVLEHLHEIETVEQLEDLKDLTYTSAGRLNLFAVYRQHMEPLFDRAIERLGLV